MWRALLLLLASPGLGSASKIFGAAPSAPDSLMADKGGGTPCAGPVQGRLRWAVDVELAAQIGCDNRRYAERAGYWAEDTSFPAEAARSEFVEFFDSVTGKLLFVAPRGRSMAAFLAESEAHGWPSFRDEEVVMENVREISDGAHAGEVVSADGTHLGHNLPDTNGNRYCVDLVSVAGMPDAIPTSAVAGIGRHAPPKGCNATVDVYFGNGCFWHTQYDLYVAEAALGRASPSARVGYAGGVGGSPSNAVCYYHGPPLSYYGSYGYAEAVEVRLDPRDAEAQFDAFARAYFDEGFDDAGLRKDPGDRGDEYRNVVGVPGGIDGPWFARLEAANVRDMPLLDGAAALAYEDQGPVYVYDSRLYPFYVGENYHQFHENIVTGRVVPKSYLEDARARAEAAGRIYPVCAEAGAAASNLAECAVLFHGGSESCSGVFFFLGSRFASARARRYWLAHPPADDDAAPPPTTQQVTYVTTTTTTGRGRTDDRKAAVVGIFALVALVAVCAFSSGLYCSRVAHARRHRFATKFKTRTGSMCKIPTENEMLEIPGTESALHGDLESHPCPEKIAHLVREHDAECAAFAAADAAAALDAVPALEDADADDDDDAPVDADLDAAAPILDGGGRPWAGGTEVL